MALHKGLGCPHTALWFCQNALDADKDGHVELYKQMGSSAVVDTSCQVPMVPRSQYACAANFGVLPHVLNMSTADAFIMTGIRSVCNLQMETFLGNTCVQFQTC